MWNVPAVVNGPMLTELVVSCRLLTVGAPGSLAGCGLPFTHEPLPKMCSDCAAGMIFRLCPLATLTHDSWNEVARVCTVPLAQLPPPPPLPAVGVEPPPEFAVWVP